MPTKKQTNNKYVTSKEFNKRIDKIEQKMATKDDIKNMATKDDISRLSKVIIQNSEDIKYLKETISTKDDIRGLKTAIDAFAGQTKDHERKAETNTYRINEIEPKIEDHGKRITALESTVPPRP